MAMKEHECTECGDTIWIDDKEPDLDGHGHVIVELCEKCAHKPKPEEQEETEKPLHPRYQAIEDEECCRHCHAHYPPWAAIDVLIPPQPKAVQLPGRIMTMPFFVCLNPDSPYFQVLLSAKGSCNVFMPIPEEVKKKPGEGIILPT